MDRWNSRIGAGEAPEPDAGPGTGASADPTWPCSRGTQARNQPPSPAAQTA